MGSENSDKIAKYSEIKRPELDRSFRRTISVTGNYFSQLFQYWFIKSLKPYHNDCMV